MEYAGRVESAAVNGNMRLRVEAEGLVMTSLFGVYAVPYAEITALRAGSYAVVLRTEGDRFTVSRLGSSCDAFYDELCTAYNARVRRALFVDGRPLLETRGTYRYDEGGVAARGTSIFEVYEHCVLLLPPDNGARRVPLCFVSALEEGEFELTLRLDTGESYTFLRLGYDTEPFAECIKQRLRALRENALRAARELDGSLSPEQLAMIAGLMPEGVAVPLGRLHGIAPSFVTALEAKIAVSRAAKEYETLREVSGPGGVCVGMKSGLAGEDAENILWIIASGARPGTAAVEIAASEGTAAATFLYGGFEDWETFRRRLNQAMEAVSFRREAIRLTEEELLRPDYADYAMAVKRNGALRFLRACFAGRVIHASPESWRRELLKFLQ